jgi:GST-like protein
MIYCILNVDQQKNRIGWRKWRAHCSSLPPKSWAGKQGTEAYGRTLHCLRFAWLGVGTVEAALMLIGAPYEVIGETVLREVACNPAVFKVNPLGQVPALVLPSGEVMTESAAILIWLADRHPDAALAPPPTDKRRPAFLRWMAYVSSAIYGLAWVRGDPMRLISDERQAEVVLDRIAARRAACWRWMDAQITDRPSPPEVCTLH